MAEAGGEKRVMQEQGAETEEDGVAEPVGVGPERQASQLRPGGQPAGGQEQEHAGAAGPQRGHGVPESIVEALPGRHPFTIATASVPADVREAPARNPSLDRGLRSLVALAGVALALWAAGEMAARRRLDRELETTARLGSALAAEPNLMRRVVYSFGAAAARLTVARAVLDVALSTAPDPSTVAGRRAHAENLARLDVAERLSGEARRERPASVEALISLGATRLARFFSTAELDAYAGRPLWEEPLLAAIALSPPDPEPRAFLLRGRLATWFALSQPERQASRELLRQAFAPGDAGAFAAFGPAWLAVAANPAEALSIVPDQPEAWSVVEAFYAEREDWETVAEARRREQRALVEAVAAAAAAERWKDFFRLATPSADFAERTQEILATARSGSLRDTAPAHLERWLDWALERFVREEPGLSPLAVDRLTSLVPPDVPSRLALAHLAAGSAAAAVAIERRSATIGAAWSPYLIAKARSSARQGAAVPAAASLELVASGWRSQAAFLRARVEVAALNRDQRELAQSRRELAALQRRQWTPFDWTWEGTRGRLEMSVAAAAPGLVLEWSHPAPHGVIEWTWDDRWQGVTPTRQRAAIPLTPAVSPGFHRLEVRFLHGPAGPAPSVDLASRAPAAAPMSAAATKPLAGIVKPNSNSS